MARAPHLVSRKPTAPNTNLTPWGSLGIGWLSCRGLGSKFQAPGAHAPSCAHQGFPHPPARACTEGWSCVLSSWAWMVSTTRLNRRLGPGETEGQAWAGPDAQAFVHFLHRWGPAPTCSLSHIED